MYMNAIAALLSSRKSESYVDTAGKILIAVAIAVILIAGLTALWNNVILPGAGDRIKDLFDEPAGVGGYTGA